MVIKGLVIVQESEVMVIERLGAYHRTLQKGINFIVPFFDKPRPIKMVRYLRKGQELLTLGALCMQTHTRMQTCEFFERLKKHDAVRTQTPVL